MTKPKKADLAKAKAKVELRRLREIDAAAAMAEYHAANAADLQKKYGATEGVAPRERSR